MRFLGENTPDRGAFRATLKDELKRHAAHTVSDVFHDDLSDVNRAFYFHEFASMLDRHDLQFLAEAELHAMGTHNLSAEARGFVDNLNDIIEREQYLDLLRARSFRQTLFCRKSVMLDRDIEPGVIDGFLISSSLRPSRAKPELASTRIEKFSGAGGTSIEIDQPLVKTVLFLLADRWGRAVAFPSLISDAKTKLAELGYSTEDWKHQTDIVRMILLQIAMASTMVELHTHQAAGFTEVTSMPKLNPVSRWQLASANNVITTLGLDVKLDDAVSKRLLELLDGTRNTSDLVYEMTNFIKISPSVDKKLLRTLPAWIDESIASLARLGVFSA